jgi:hypothetical protein
VIEIATFVCSICGESSTDICIYCTKDTCSNHRCVRCRRCSDCCECEVPLTAAEPVRETVATATEPWLAPAAHPEPARHPEPLPRTEPVPAPTTETGGPELASRGPATHEELVRSLPELFAPDRPAPAPPEGADKPGTPPAHGEHAQSEEEHGPDGPLKDPVDQ